ncbi:MAG: CysB family HTH-type transcriptional regulator [Hyphomicrobiaceae bacterium]
MNFQQLRIVRETVRRNFNLTEVANALFTSQSGVSKHIKDLESELGVELFVRRGKRLLGLTDPGKELIDVVERILIDAANIKQLGEQFSNREQGQLVIATTHTQARYVLPHVVAAFRTAFPKVRLTLHQGSPTEIAAMLSDGDADIGICTETLRDVASLTTFPFYSWHHGVVVPRGHALATVEPLTLEAIAEWPIITYHEGYTGRGIIDRTFAQAGLAPDVVMSAMDTDVLKAYVELGLGVGIIAAMAFDPRRDAGLKLIDAAHLFEVNTALVGVRRGSCLRNYAYRFIELCSPALPERAVRAAVMAEQGRPEAAERRTLEAPYRSNGNTLSREEVRRTG